MQTGHSKLLLGVLLYLQCCVLSRSVVLYADQLTDVSNKYKRTIFWTKNSESLIILTAKFTKYSAMATTSKSPCTLPYKIGFIGAGQMALALAKGFMASGLLAPSQVIFGQNIRPKIWNMRASMSQFGSEICLLPTKIMCIFRMAAMPFPCNGILLVQCNLPRVC